MNKDSIPSFWFRLKLALSAFWSVLWKGEVASVCLWKVEKTTKILNKTNEVNEFPFSPRDSQKVMDRLSKDRLKIEGTAARRMFVRRAEDA
jgi:hypothetical protein